MGDKDRDQKSEAQRQTEAEAARLAAAKQETQMRPAPGERRPGGGVQPGVVPTSGPLVEGTGVVGQHPYTDPPPMARRRFYEDPVPVGQATEQQVLQGRGAPPPYPPDAQFDRAWDPRCYPDQAATMRPSDSPTPTEAEARGGSFTFGQFMALPIEEQDRLLGEARQNAPFKVPEYRPTSEVLAEEDRRREESEKLQREAAAQREARQSQGVQSMAPATPGTVTA